MAEDAILIQWTVLDVYRHFLRRTPDLTVKRRADLEKSRRDAMSADVLVSHFERVSLVYSTSGIKTARQIFNIDESGLSTKPATRALAKAMTRSDSRCDMSDLNWKLNFNNYITIMPVSSADMATWNLVVISRGAKARCRIKSALNNTIGFTPKAPAEYLPYVSYITYH